MMSYHDDWRSFDDDRWVNYEARIDELVGHVQMGQWDLHWARSEDAKSAYDVCDLFYYESDEHSWPPNMVGWVWGVQEHEYCGCEGCCSFRDERGLN